MVRENILSFVLILFCVNLTLAQNKTSEWVNDYSGNSNVYSYDVVADDIGNTYTIGKFSGTVDFDGSNSVFNLTGSVNGHIFICKLDPFGGLIWVRQFSSASNPVGYSIDLDNQGNVYATGHFFTSIDMDPGAGVSYLTATGRGCFILKLNTNGLYVWANKFTPQSGTWGCGGYDISVRDNHVYVTGEYRGPYDFNSGAGVSVLPVYTTDSNIQDVFVTKLDLNGNFIWARGFGGVGGDISRTVKADGNGNVYISGYYSGTSDFDPGASVYNLTSGAAGNERNCYILKLNPTGDFVWVKHFEGALASSSATKSFDIDQNDDLYLTGYFKGTTDFDPNLGTSNLTSGGNWDGFVVKLLNSGDFSWVKQIEGSEAILPTGIDITSNNDPVITGGFQGTADLDPSIGVSNQTSQGLYDGFVLFLNGLNGDFIEQAHIAKGVGNDLLRGVSMNNLNEVFLTGYFQQTTDFGASCVSIMKSASNYDGVTLKINTCPLVLPVELELFKATINQYNLVELSWITVSELNNDFFIIEKSKDGTTWLELNRVEGIGSSQDKNEYSIIDDNPFTGFTYYHIKQVDYDGEFTFSKVISVELDNSLETILYPNPSKDFVILNQNFEERTVFELYNQWGKNVTSLIKIESLDGKTILRTQQLHDGLYFVKIEDECFKFIISK